VPWFPPPLQLLHASEAVSKAAANKK